MFSNRGSWAARAAQSRLAFVTCDIFICFAMRHDNVRVNHGVNRQWMVHHAHGCTVAVDAAGGGQPGQQCYYTSRKQRQEATDFSPLNETMWTKGCLFSSECLIYICVTSTVGGCIRVHLTLSISIFMQLLYLTPQHLRGKYCTFCLTADSYFSDYTSFLSSENHASPTFGDFDFFFFNKLKDGFRTLNKLLEESV